MKVQVNNKEVEIADTSTITQLTVQLELPTQGIAIAAAYGLGQFHTPRE